MPRKYRSELLASVHETAEAFHRVGAINKKSMRYFDETCLTPVSPLSADEIKALRLKTQASQAVFALHLNVTTGLISQWERGEKKPSGPALKLLTIVKKRGLAAVS